MTKDEKLKATLVNKYLSNRLGGVKSMTTTTETTTETTTFVFKGGVIIEVRRNRLLNGGWALPSYTGYIS